MSNKAMILMGASLLALGVSSCTKPEATTKTVARKPLDTKKPLAPQLFPTPATNNAWFHVITTSDELKFNAKSANAGAAKISTTVPNKPPTAEKTSPAPKAISACPFLVMAKASSV